MHVLTSFKEYSKIVKIPGKVHQGNNNKKTVIRLTDRTTDKGVAYASR